MVQIRPVTLADAGGIAAIYNPYVLGTWVSFETEAVATATMAQRIAEVQSTTLPWLVTEHAGQLLGYACATPWKGRPAYRHSVESTVYLDRAHLGRGLGGRLYSALLAELRARQLHTAIGGIALPNAPSVALHERLGFRKVAHFEQVGHKLGRWVDVGYWQLLLQPTANSGALSTADSGTD